ncbi:MAG TPA: glutamate--tRNA ligase, partial [Actinomycetota bacterium]|nr:glutamate--tRNA ligase [Actinomycetota bacterium]
ARHHAGVFILRVEDTDPARNTEEAYHAALYDLRWVGLDWDEGPETGGQFGPYRQSERDQLYREAGLKLLEEGRAYRCYCTPDELDARRKHALAEKRKPMYDERCFHLSDEERETFEAEGRPSAVRFRVPESGSITFTDIVRGEVVTDNEQIEDFVILRSDGSPLYQLAVVVDDVGMQITHVIRGDDHLSNTPKQILLHQALGGEPPVFAHVPQVSGQDGKPLSKRHGSVSVKEFREGGYLPEALMNYLALLGWGTAEDTIMQSPELIERFRIEDVHSSPARFDHAKLEWMNGEYIRLLPLEDLATRLEPWLAKEGLIKEPPTESERELLAKVVPLINTRIRRLDEAAVLARSLFMDVEMDPAAVNKAMKDAHVRQLLERAVVSLEELTDWRYDLIEERLRQIQQEMELKPKTAFGPIRVAVSGTLVSPPLFESMEILGKDESLRRLRGALATMGGTSKDEL